MKIVKNLLLEIDFEILLDSKRDSVLYVMKIKGVRF